MNNSAEVEKIKTPEEYFTKEYPHPSPGTYHGWFKFAEAYHQYAREKELSALTDEVIRGMFPGEFMDYVDAQEAKRKGAKALRDHLLKQNNESKSSEG